MGHPARAAFKSNFVVLLNPLPVLVGEAVDDLLGDGLALQQLVLQGRDSTHLNMSQKSSSSTSLLLSSLLVGKITYIVGISKPKYTISECLLVIYEVNLPVK